MRNNSNRTRVLSGMFWKFSERICAQLVSLIVSIVLARILDPDHYGVVSIILVFINIANVFVTTGFSSALIQKKNADTKDFSTIFYFNIVFSIVLYAIIFVAAPIVEGFYKMEDLSLAMRILGLKIPISAVNSVQQAYVSRHMQFRKFFFATIIGTVISAFVGIYMAYKGFGVFALVAQYLTNSTIDTIILWFAVKWRPTREFSFERMKGLLSYGWKILVADLIRAVYEDIYSLVIGKKYTSEDLAFYSKGKHYPQLIVTNVNTTITSVLFPALSKFQDDKEQLCKIMRRSIRTSSYILSPLMIGMAAVAEPLVRLVLTEKWLPCVPFLRIACFYLLLMPMQSANLQAIKAVGRSDLTLKLEIVKRVVGIVTLIVTMQFGVMAIALGSVFVTVVASVLNAIPNRKLLNYTYTQQIKDMVPSFSMSLVMGILVYLIGYIGLNDLATLIIQVCLGGFIYVGLSIITKNDDFKYILSTIKRNKKEK